MNKIIFILILFASFSLSAGNIHQKIESCNAGDAGSCDMVGFTYQMKKDYMKAAEYYGKGCDKNFASSCYELARMYRYGVAVDKDAGKAKELFAKACKGHYEEACKALEAMSGSTLYSDSNITSKDLNQNYSPSFDCEQAKSQSEKDICRSKTVSALDRRLGNLYKDIKKSMPEQDFDALMKIQRVWVKNRDTVCSVQNSFSKREKCLTGIYNKRLDAFSLISVQDASLQDFKSVYLNGSGEARLRLAVHLYLDDGATEKALKLIYKVIADKQNEAYDAFVMLQKLHRDYLKEFKDISKEDIENNHNSVGYLLWQSGQELEQVLPVLLKEASFLNPIAEISLTLIYQNTHDRRILSFFESCAKEGIPRCKEVTGEIYFYGWGVKQNVMKGIELLEKSQLEDAYMILASYYYTNQDMTKSKSYYSQSSSLGNTLATYNLGVIAQEEKKYENAVEYFTLAIKQDKTNYSAISELARMYVEGWGVKQDLVKAMSMLQTVLDNSKDEELKKYVNFNMGAAEYLLAREWQSEKNTDKKKALEKLTSKPMPTQ